ncbi:hypothetical protein DSCO28_67140 [Desulfosarcina ovata subsp. sediminis]|uniref:Macroglobulin domain-containing protein n=1 Tax=Desulfosarcina ovata subsp. sediminis TaxID=885957 RepID=A0A5K8A1B1_9BACT|nr:hypothetical protein [Desulfosarcina ovata]BBO86148.1 hypothetical protein DSCO28_67140 [Desulfosarcina ovata subsp. sediminis]
MKRILALATIILLVFLTNHALADVTIRVTNLPNRIMRVTYLWIYDKAGDTQFTTAGLLFAKSPLKIVNVIEKNTEQELHAEVVSADKQPNAQAVRVTFPNPVPKGGNYKIEITVEAETDGISRDANGRYSFTYETGHIAFFVLPKGHAVVYSNYPVLVYERKGNTVLQVKESGKKKLIFKTRAFVSEEAATAK